MEVEFMVCYVIPTIAALIHHGTRKSISRWNNSIHQKWLGLLLAGGALFGIIDHLWNGELLLIGENIISDLLLGTTITIVICVVWAVIVILDNLSHKKGTKTTQ